MQYIIIPLPFLHILSALLFTLIIALFYLLSLICYRLALNTLWLHQLHKNILLLCVCCVLKKLTISLWRNSSWSFLPASPSRWGVPLCGLMNILLLSPFCGFLLFLGMHLQVAPITGSRGGDRNFWTHAAFGFFYPPISHWTGYKILNRKSLSPEDQKLHFPLTFWHSETSLSLSLLHALSLLVSLSSYACF